jgi:ribose 5-phosphate isomerase
VIDGIRSDPHKNLIKGVGAAHTSRKIANSQPEQFIAVVDEKLKRTN